MTPYTMRKTARLFTFTAADAIAMGLAGAALVLPGAALAQDAAASIQAAGADAGGIEEIVVTAQKRVERLRDVPISITAQSGAELERRGVSDTRDLVSVVPGLTMQSVGATVQPSIRGVTTQLAEPGSEVNIATYVDGVYRPDPSVGAYDLPDISRIEVSKGPQGTLFGRNATGGAIQIFTKDPEFTPTGNITLGYGNLDDRTAKGFLTGPVVADVVAVSLSGSYQKHDGYIRDLFLGGKAGRLESKSVRGKVLIRPTDTVKLLLSGYYSDRFDENGETFQPLNGNSLARVLDPTSIIPTRKRETASNQRGEVSVKSKGVSLRATVDLPFATLTSITAYDKLRSRIILDGDATSTNVANYNVSGRNRDFTQEFNLASNSDGPVSWIAGANYYFDKNFFDPNVINPGAVFIVAGVTTRSYAAFGELSYKLTDRLSLTGGVRYTHEHRVADAVFSFGAPPASVPRLGVKNYNSVTPRGTVKYQVDDDSNVYFTYTQGFKSGVFNLFSLNPNALKPEKITAYELGYKTQVGRRYSLSAATFYYRYTDQQVNALTNVNGIPLTSVQNAASANIYGGEIDGSFAVTKEFSFRAGVSYLHARYDKFVNASVQVPTGLGGNRTIVIDASGFEEIRSPELTVTLTANFEKEFDAGKFDSSVTLYHSDHYFLDTGNRVRQPGYETLAAQASFSFAQTGLRVGVWGKNLTNADVFVSNLISDLGDPVQYGTKRTYGVTVGYSF